MYKAMDQCYLLLCFLTCLGLGVTVKSTVNGSQTANGTAELSRIRATLAQLQDSNKRLARQNRRLQKVWTGLQKMCSAIQTGCTCNGNTGPVTPGPGGGLEISTIGTGTTTVTGTTLKIEAIESSGIMIDDSINVTVVYTHAGPDRVFTEWRLQRERFRATGLIRRNGTTSRRLADSGTVHMSSFKLVETTNVRYLDFVLTSGEEEFNIVFNVSALHEKGVEKMDPWNATVRISSPEGKLISPETDDLRFNVTVDGLSQEEGDIEAYIMGVNTSAAPPVAFQVITWDREDIMFTLNDAQDSTPERRKHVATVTVRNRVSRFGGMLQFRVMRRRGGYTKRDGYSIIRDVFPRGAEETVPVNTYGWFPEPKQVFAIATEVSVVCAAMGNPQPRLTIEKSGKPAKALDADLIYEASYLTVVSYTLNSTEENVEGKYTCNLHDNNDTDVILSTTSYDVVIPKEFEFHQDKTGVVKNNSKKMLVSCEASGTPRPELGLDLYQRGGPDVARSGIYKVSRTYPSANTTRIQITISPVNEEITTLYCSAQHREFEFKFYRIELFPASADYRNWELYNQMFNMTRANN